VFQWPADGQIRVPGLSNQVRSVRVLGNTQARPTVTREGEQILVKMLPAAPPDEIASVVAIELDGSPRVTRDYVVRADGSGVIQLGAETAEIESNLGQRAKKENLLGHVYLGQWTRAADRAVWVVNVAREGDYKAEISYGSTRDAESNPFLIQAGKSELRGDVKRTASELAFRTFPLGTIHLAAGEQTIRIAAPDRGKGPGINFERLVLAPSR
jgi:alpha-L-fucosidase